MKILVIADEESSYLWDYYSTDKLKEIDLIISCGDLSPHYLSFLVTLSSAPLLYIHGNHDDKYEQTPPEGCICIEDDIYIYKGIRILGLGGSMRYRPGKNQYTERQMRARIRKLRFKLLYRRGFDILVTHSPAYQLNDGMDLPHQGFRVFRDLIIKYHPKYFVHGHIHQSYGRHFRRCDQLGDTIVINACERYTIDYKTDAK